MDPSALMVTTMVPAVVELLAKVLRTRDKRPLAKHAESILQATPASEPHVRDLFQDAKRRVEATWRVGLFMTISLFALFVGMAITAVATSILTGKSTYPIVFGGISATSLLTVVLWKPYEKTFQAATTAQRLEMILVGLETSWASCHTLVDADQRSQCVAKANAFALQEMAKVAR